ncbi:DUF2946 domain-containing protein [Methylosinus sporium]|uniref:DUF2946 domain-containing protein n=1 Tax=Methylosinus sporium TaxID=428 RepID=A0A549SXP4_METSR|nr:MULTISPECIES: DUF2946 family protein [Methylosinus]MBU3889402.1 DUF2946 family protein [Methylosinus sp. KRF6]TRL34394.1 DUF2946 domain-containing protein [Methylosinus sporium]
MAAVAKLLFLFALLGQALSAPLGGARAHVAGGEATRLCVVAHVVASAASAASDRGEPTRKSDPSHRHGACGFCELGAGGLPFLALAERVGAPPLRAATTRPSTIFAAIPFSRDDSNAPTRASPSFS